jgi:hypothetical protein
VKLKLILSGRSILSVKKLTGKANVKESLIDAGF